VLLGLAGLIGWICVKERKKKREREGEGEGDGSKTRKEGEVVYNVGRPR